VIRGESEFGKPAYFLTGILKRNTEALRNIAHPSRDLGYHYMPLVEVDMVNVYGRWGKSPKGDLRVRRARADDEARLREFLEHCEKRKLFGSADWDYRLKAWPGFAIENFLLAEDANGALRACTLPWDPGSLKRMLVTQAPGVLQTAMGFLRIFGWKTPRVGQALKVTYLTHLNFAPSVDRAWACAALVDFLYDQGVDAHMIAFQDESGFSKKMKWIQQRVGVCLFAVVLDPESLPPLNAGQEVGFEMALV
jgi:hypothetical protein